MFWCIGRSDTVAVEIGNETVVILDAQVKVTGGNFFKVTDLEGKPEVERAVFACNCSLKSNDLLIRSWKPAWFSKPAPF